MRAVFQTDAARRHRFLIAALTLLLPAACNAPRPEGVTAQAIAPVVAEVRDVTASGPTSYVFSRGDQVDIRFPFRPDFNVTETVRPDGRISAALVGAVDVAGQTPEQVTAALRAAYAGLRRSVPAPARRSYRIQAGDTLDIRFNDSHELNDQALVRPDGRITLAIVGSRIAEGKTPEALARELIAAYSEKITLPELVVIVRSMANRQFVAGGQVTNSPIQGLEDVSVVPRSFPTPRVYVGGEVQRPGEQPFSGQISLLQAVISAGGATSTGEMRSVVVVRRNTENKPFVFIINVKNDLEGAIASDIPLQQFDVVFVPKTQIANTQDVLEQYLYRLIPALRNSSVGFSYIATSSFR